MEITAEGEASEATKVTNTNLGCTTLHIPSLSLTLSIMVQCTMTRPTM